MRPSLPDLRKTAVKDIWPKEYLHRTHMVLCQCEPLSKAAGIPYLRERLVYIPDDPRLQRFRANFKNMVALMEEREPPGVKKLITQMNCL